MRPLTDSGRLRAQAAAGGDPQVRAGAARHRAWCRAAPRSAVSRGAGRVVQLDLLLADLPGDGALPVTVGQCWVGVQLTEAWVTHEDLRSAWLAGAGLGA